MDLLTNGIISVTGATKKARIFIQDKRVNTTMPVSKKGPVSPGATSPIPLGNVPGGGQVNKLKAAASAAAGKVASGLKTATNAVVEVAAGNLVDDYSDVKKDYNKSFEVQFNPSTLNISGFSGGSYELVDYSGKGAGAKTTPLHPNLSLNVTLVFDQMDLSNSFPMDSIDFSISANAMKAMKAVQGMTNYMPISVQAATEGLVAALSNQYTRLVCFAWGKQIRYKGVLKSVNANYKLFDIMGRPVRSEVALSIYLADKDVMAAGGESKLGIWKEAYDEAFDDAIGYGKTATDTYKKVSETIFG